ncbi:MAG: chemotaxis protein CheX [bacterium]|nr:chemotaxis protein CheX [bacterium]
MDIKYINPFIESLLNNLEQMAAIKAVKKELSVTREAKTTAEISGIIGLSGGVKGSAIISFPKPIALAVASAMFMEELKELNDDVKDAIGEFANIFVGNARNKLVDSGLNVTISTPTIIVGKDHEISHPQNIPFLVIPFETDLGIFTINIGVKEDAK